MEIEAAQQREFHRLCFYVLHLAREALRYDRMGSKVPQVCVLALLLVSHVTLVTMPQISHW